MAIVRGNVLYILEHARECDGVEDIKTLGYFGSEEEANADIKFYLTLPGFVDYPGAFRVLTWTVGDRGWSEGFSAVNEEYMNKHFNK